MRQGSAIEADTGSLGTHKDGEELSLSDHRKGVRESVEACLRGFGCGRVALIHAAQRAAEVVLQDSSVLVGSELREWPLPLGPAWDV